MAEQLSLAPVHHNDPETSAIAASRVNASRQYRLVLMALYNAEKPLTDDELAELCGLLRHAAGTRRGVAVKDGRVERVGRGMSAHGNPAATWALTDAGRRWVVETLAGAA